MELSLPNDIFIEYWAKCWCPECQTPNWIYSHRNDGDDTSCSDMFGMKCWKCGKSSWFDEETKKEAHWMYSEYDDEDNIIPIEAEGHVEKGREHP